MHYVNVMYKCILVFTFMIIYCIWGPQWRLTFCG
jgi:hypothetical protein